MLGFNSSEEILNFTNYDISDRNVRFEMCIKELWHEMSRKVDLLKELHSLVRAFKKPDTSPRGKIFRVYKKIITKLTDYFFTIIDLGTVSFVNESLFNQQKKNSKLIKCFGPMYIDFNEYSCYSGRNYEIFVNMLLKIFSVSMVMHILQVNKKCAHGLMKTVGE